MSTATLRAALAEHGGTLAAVLAGDAGRVEDVRDDDGAVDGVADGAAIPAPGIGAPQRASRGPRAAGHAAEYELLLEMILEGSLLHYGAPRVVCTEDSDLALLLGDQLYALGLARLAELGDLASVSELADLISLLSQARLDDDAALARAVWEAGATAIGWGASDEHEAAKALARDGDASAVASLLQCARRDVHAQGSEGSAD